MTLRSVKGLVVPMLVAGLEACATTAPSEPTLYKRLGGREGIALVVDDFVANVVADDRINARFKSLPPPAVFRLKSNLADQICEATGGSCSDRGRDLQTAHRGMNVTETEWNATVEALVKALDKHRGAERDKEQLLGVLGPMKQGIVGL